MKEKKTKRIESGRIGSALIMTIVLTVLLSIVAVMFVAVARMDMAATSNIADNKMLESAARSIIEIISKELVLDTPGVAGQEYYDYADVCDIWLASLQPYQDKTDPNVYKWHQISDATSYLAGRSFAVRDVKVKPSGSRSVIKDYPDIVLNAGNELDEGSPDDGDGSLNNKYRGQPADADGDGILDSKWFELKDIRSSKGKPIYAAVRVIDNGGMININTAQNFDANSINPAKVDGTSQMQINLKGLLKGTSTEIDNQFNALLTARCGGEDPNNWTKYEKDVIWRYGIPDGNYLPFDISDELELRYRYCIDSKFISRFEYRLPYTAEGAGTRNFGNLYDGKSEWGLDDWKIRITNPSDPNTDHRHLLTAYNLDRVISPSGGKMTNINTADVNTLYRSIRRGLLDADSNFPDVNGISAQIAVNIKDYRDSDSDVNDFNVGGTIYYGFERPCIYISELAFRFVPSDPNVGDPNHRSYAIELYKPYKDEDFNDWRVRIPDTNETVDINGIWSGDQFYVIMWQDTFAPLTSLWAPNDNRGDPAGETKIFDTNSTIYLERKVNSNWIVADRVTVPSLLVDESNGTPRAYQRDITNVKCIRRLWDKYLTEPNPTLGYENKFKSPDPNTIQAHPANGPFRNIGEIGMVFRKGAYYKLGGDSNGIIGYNGLNTESQVRLNLADPKYQQIFKYLTVMDPNSNSAETRVKGRININTAPGFVIAQLPWVSQRRGGYNDVNLAKAIVAYRDKSGPDYSSRPGSPGIGSIGELCNVNRGSDPNYGINYYSRDKKNQPGFPDLDPNDGAADDFEERDLIFARISDLVTVRSDMFTAYMLVRIGTDGPQKRYMVILDRSGVTPTNNKVAIRAFQTVPEAR
jgi:hypothetical protein